MSRMAPGFVNLIMTSPPYAEARKANYGGVHPDLYIEWFLQRAFEFYRILAQDGSFILNIGDNTVNGETHLYTYDLPGTICRVTGFKLIDAFIWHKKVAPPGKFPNRFKGSWEFCFHFAKQTKIKFNPLSVAIPTKESSRSRINRHKSTNGHLSQTASGFNSGRKTVMRQLTKTKSGLEHTNEVSKSIVRRMRKNGSGFGTNDEKLLGYDVSLPSNVLHLAPESTNKGHSAVFPTQLPEFFIKAFTDEGDIVYDPFSGSGTTCEVAKVLNRNYIGSEHDKRQVRKSIKRLEAA